MTTKTYRVFANPRRPSLDQQTLYLEATTPALAVSEAIARLKRMGLNPKDYDIQVKGTVKS